MAGNHDDDCDAATADATRRLERFQASCAAMREKTAAELARLATKRADTRRTIGATSEQMNEWLEEHQQMLRRDP